MIKTKATPETHAFSSNHTKRTGEHACVADRGPGRNYEEVSEEQGNNREGLSDAVQYATRVKGIERQQAAY